MNCLKSHNLDNLVLIVEAKNMMRINIGVINIYTFLHAYFEGVGFYTARKYFHLKIREGIKTSL